LEAASAKVSEAREMKENTAERMSAKVFVGQKLLGCLAVSRLHNPDERPALHTGVSPAGLPQHARFNEPPTGR
jgi:hypothetical protein